MPNRNLFRMLAYLASFAILIASCSGGQVVPTLAPTQAPPSPTVAPTLVLPSLTILPTSITTAPAPPTTVPPRPTAKLTTSGDETFALVNGTLIDGTGVAPIRDAAVG
jgi:hypothetical protein